MEFLLANWYWAALAVASGSWLLFETLRNRNGTTSLSPVEATMLINREDAIIVDVRDQGEYAQGHIPDARHIPLGELTRRIAELDTFKTRPLILCCASGARSATAMTQLARAGFERLYNLQGGLIEWQKAGHPVRRSKKK